MKKVNDTFGLVPFKMRRGAGGGFILVYREEYGYELQYHTMCGSIVTHKHSTVITKEAYDALRKEAKRNFRMMEVIVGYPDRGLTP